MTDAILLNKLINEYNEDDNFLFECYKDSLSTSDITETFDKCIEDLKKLSELSYDFNTLTEYSNRMEITRRDVRQLCEMLSSILGETIIQLCCQDKEFIITKPSGFEDFCPYPKEELVWYSIDFPESIGMQVRHDGYVYRVIESRPENTPYYYIHCNLLERIY